MCTTQVQQQQDSIHCPKNNLNLRIKTEPNMAGADATLYLVSGICKQMSGPET